MIAQENKYTNINGIFPDAVMIDATGAGLTDGSEFAALPLNDGWEPFSQAIMDYVNGGTNQPTGTPGTPNGVRDAKGVSQIIQAIMLAMGGGPGTFIPFFGASDPSVTGHRILLLQEQGILIANYPDLVANVYVGDGTNAAVHAGGGKFYKSSDSGGTTPNIAGPYLQLPEGRGYTLRGLDLAASIDPLGAARFLGDNQADAGQTIQGILDPGSGNATTSLKAASGSGAFTITAKARTNVLNNAASVGSDALDFVTFDSSNSTSPNTAKTDDDETRMSNLSIKLGIVY